MNPSPPSPFPAAPGGPQSIQSIFSIVRAVFGAQKVVWARLHSPQMLWSFSSSGSLEFLILRMCLPMIGCARQRGTWNVTCRICNAKLEWRYGRGADSPSLHPEKPLKSCTVTVVDKWQTIHKLKARPQDTAVSDTGAFSGMLFSGNVLFNEDKHAKQLPKPPVLLPRGNATVAVAQLAIFFAFQSFFPFLSLPIGGSSTGDVLKVSPVMGKKASTLPARRTC